MIKKKQEKKLSTDEKIDLLLDYQKKIKRYNLIRMIFSILVFLIVVVLPVIGFVWLSDYFKEELGLDPNEFRESLEQFQENMNKVDDLSSSNLFKNL